MKKLLHVRYLLGSAIIIHAAVFTGIGSMIAPPKPLLPPQNVTIPSPNVPQGNRYGEKARQVLKRYIQMHSIEQLEQECPSHGRGHVSLETDCPDLARRRFAVWASTNARIKLAIAFTTF